MATVQRSTELTAMSVPESELRYVEMIHSREEVDSARPWSLPFIWTSHASRPYQARRGSLPSPSQAHD